LFNLKNINVIEHQHLALTVVTVI